MTRGMLVAMFLAMTPLGMDHALAQKAAPSSQDLSAKTHKAQVLLDQYYGNRNNIAQAQQYVVEVLEAAPRFVPAYIQAARVMIMGGHIVSRQFASGTLEGAEGVLLKAKELEPNNAEVHVLLGHVNYLKGDLDAATLALETAKRLKSTNPWLNNNFGDVFLRIRQIDIADRHFQLVTDLGAGTTAQQLRAYVYALQKRQWVAALRENNAEVLRLGKMAVDAAPPEDAWVGGDVANVLFIQGYFDESIAHSRKALSIMNYGVGRSTLALGLYGKWASMVASGRGPEAEKYFAEAYALNSNLTQVVQRFAQSAMVVVSLVPIVEKRQAELRR